MTAPIEYKTNVDAIISSLQARVDDYRARLDSLSSVLMGQGYIVMAAHNVFAIDPEIVDMKTTGNFVMRSVHTAPRFTYRDALVIAATVTNGQGEKGRAVHILTALQNEIIETEKTIETLRRAIAGSEE